MAQDILHARLQQELKHINGALLAALAQLPPPCQPQAKHIFEAGGKRLRPFLAIICARLAGSDSPAIYRLASSMEMLHAATLLHDDILDQAESRRGRPAAHTIFGIPATILAGDALLALGCSVVAEFNNPALCRCYSEATMRTAGGEILEMSSLGQPDLPYEKYLEIARGKTACLIAQACVLGATFADAGQEEVENFAIFGENLGLAFQLVDDALDFAPETMTGKPRGGDLREAKMTSPLRLYRDSLDAARRKAFDAAFANRSFTAEKFDEILEAMPEFAQKSLALADERLDLARQALESLPDRPERVILYLMADYVRRRTY